MTDPDLLVAALMARLEKILSIPEGCCMACGQPLRLGQNVFFYPGPNLLNPLLGQGAIFHDHFRCVPAATGYERLWLAQDPSRRPSRLTGLCSGRLTVHGDGTAECLGRAGGDCPTVYARHRAVKPCYDASLGCGRGCTEEGHPGTRLAEGLTPEGYLP